MLSRLIGDLLILLVALQLTFTCYFIALAMLKPGKMLLRCGACPNMIARSVDLRSSILLTEWDNVVKGV